MQQRKVGFLFRTDATKENSLNQHLSNVMKYSRLWAGREKLANNFCSGGKKFRKKSVFPSIST